MKKNIENNFKQSLGNHEMPYNPAAWTSLSAKLDAKMPVTSPKSNFKWYAAASTIVVIAVSSYFIFKGETETHAQNDVITSQNEVVTPENKSNNENTNPVTDNNTTVSENLTETQNTSTSTDPIVNNEPANGANVLYVVENPVNPEANKKMEDGNGTHNEIAPTLPENGMKPADKLVIPTVTDICEGSTFVIENVNDEALLIEGPEMHYIVPANSKRTVRAKASGIHTIGSLNAESTTTRTEFLVKNVVMADFSIDSENKFEKGLPTTKVIANVTGANCTWIFNNLKVNGNEANAHFYTKGNHDISLTVTANNGCANTITKSVYVDEKYNLMAENAFIPTDIDPRNSTFMPFALKERNVKFNLRIYDTRDGHVIFETNDSSNGWDGKDKTGQMVAYEKAYVWKVIIENPEPNENNEYGGSIMPLPLR